MVRQIACGHCGHTHASVAEVRACANVGGPPAPSAPSRRATPSPTPDTAAAVPPAQRPTSSPSLRVRRGPDRPAADLAGPDALGRSVLIGPDQEAPAPWAAAPVVEADNSAPAEVVERLHRAWRNRERLVIRWRGPLPDPDPVLRTDFWLLEPTTELDGERLRFAVTANTVDAREPAAARFEPLTVAQDLGAGPGSEAADMTLPDGREAWVDGGPLAPFGAADLAQPGTRVELVVPRHHLITGRLRPQRPAPAPPGADLAPDQLAAVAHRGGPARIIAPAGSGKTRVLTERTRHLVTDWGLDPSVVSLVAYNRRARQEMGQRLQDVPGLEIRTLNSLALALATGRRAGASSRRALTTISEVDARRMLERLVPGRRRRQLADPLEAWIDALSACRLGLRDPDEVEASYGADIAGFTQVLDGYRDALRRAGALDFDEQILAAVEVLLTDPAARADARRATPVLLVDEFQDLTPAHLLLVRLLAGPAGEVYAVGDDDQTIYGYSGASPQWLVDFERYFPGAADHRLTVNYRCPPAVVTAAANLLTHNRYRVAKAIDPAPGRAPVEGELVTNHELDPQPALVARVNELVASGTRPGDIAVLARVNAALMPAALHLILAGHPVARPPGLDSRLLDRSGIAAALAWLRLAAAGRSGFTSDDLRLALRRPPRSLHPRIVDWVCDQRSVERLLALADRLNSERDAATVAGLAGDLDRLQRRAAQGASTVELLDLVYRDIGLLGAVSQLDQSQRNTRRAAHSDELAALRAVADLAPGPAELEPWIRAHLDALPRHDADDGPGAGSRPADGDGGRVTLATIHATKGLEWPHVIVHDARHDLHPHRLAADWEEERRIFHVAITRGRDTVLVNAPPPDDREPPSPFLAELRQPRRPDEGWSGDGPDDRAGRSLRLVHSSGSPRPGPGGGAGANAAGGRAQALAPGPQAAGPGRGSGKPVRAEPADSDEAARRQSLTAWRTERCAADAVPAYIVLDNATLDAIAAANPASLAALGRIRGIGPAKLERYGADILSLLAAGETPVT